MTYEEYVKSGQSWDSKVIRRDDYEWTMSQQSQITAPETETETGVEPETPPQDTKAAAETADDKFTPLPDYVPIPPKRETEAVGACPECDEARRKAAQEKIVVKKPEAKKKVVVAKKDEPADTKDAAEETAPSSGKASYIDKLMRTLNAHKGRAWAGKNLCYRGVKRILIAAGITKKYLPGANAYDAMKDLKTIGFKNYYPNNCNTPGVIRVYKGAANGMSKAAAKRYIWKNFRKQATAGDRAGHIEIMGTDGRYYHFNGTGSPTPINSSSHFGPKRRILTGCFLK